ncbi:hypothetical protein FGG08_001696 [Glutinoglossum americanum]|uniref:Protein kinase domain-containing protein n=1 Tax=Glutinoglossum americanum TaxID=1670608 RepID=A0A9P8I6G0_9PEZI|nr:hypothetical protein FGG08_001696 [Glutinoglossum americanum]
MFASALKSFTSNISSNYTWSSNPSFISGPWKVYDAKKKSTGRAVSVFVFDKKSLEQVGGLSRSAGQSVKRAHEEVIERLKKEASSLARLRHPSILEVVEQVEETRNGGLMFATEQVTVSLAGLLAEKDEQERAGGVGGRSSRYVIEETEGGGRRRREVEIDELEIQKGLLQIGKGLEFLHESAGLLHGNLTPEAIYVNAKSDWKISGLAFSSPPAGSNTPTSVTPISLAEVLNHDPRLPRSVQLNLDFTSPDFVLDSNPTASADLFSLGLLIIALYNSPHTSPLQTNSSTSTYKRLFSSSSTTPSQTNNFLSSRPLPKELTSVVLPRLVTRRPVTRLTAREFQQSQYFDNILVSTIRFLDALPAKTPNEKAQFMRGLPRVLPQFPKSVLDRKLLPALIDEMKDRELLALILQNIFQIVKMMPSGRRAFTEKVISPLKEVFSVGGGGGKNAAATERESSKEAGLMVLLENLKTITESCSGKEFKDDILPIVMMAMDSPAPSLVDAALGSLPIIIGTLDFSTIKNDLFPVIATVFSKTSSLGIKVRGLEAFIVLCGGDPELDGSAGGRPDEMTGDANDVSKKTSPSAVLDKYTVQEKVVPLLKAIKTKEPAVMMAALNVFGQVGKIADADFLATEVLPILWAFSLGPLLNLQQFRKYMDLIQSLSKRIEQEQTRKLQELSHNSVGSPAERSKDFMTFSATAGPNAMGGAGDSAEVDFEQLVLGKTSGSSSGGANGMLDGGWGDSSIVSHQGQQPQPRAQTPTFSWSTPSPTSQPTVIGNTSSSRPAALSSQLPAFRSITPDEKMGNFTTLTPSNAAGASIQASSGFPALQPQTQHPRDTPALNWSGATAPSTNVWSNQQRTNSSPSLSSMSPLYNPVSNISIGQPTGILSQPSTPGFALPPPPQQQRQLPGSNNAFSGWALPPPPPHNPVPIPQQPRYGAGLGTGGGPGGSLSSSNNNQKSGLDKYESLL